ncbi:cell envelope integrity TolA C-terminal domain-containing protein [Klebsiella spallanzanii]|uniref:cell envelope integrity TolA C-terminal domain-containing protein n=1 Tax=Klebsiella spallanzanii TaxID=2587528 RepID=UPI00115EA810
MRNGDPYLQRFVTTAQSSIMEQPQSYQGKKCSVRLMLQRDGTVDNPQVESGDPVLCAEIMSALKEAKIPPAPDEQTYLVFKNATLDFTL